MAMDKTRGPQLETMECGSRAWGAILLELNWKE